MNPSNLTPKDAARSLYQRTDTSEAPVDLVPVLRHLGMIVDEGALIGTDGTLRQVDDHWRIMLRRSMSHTKKRWEVAKQVGICVMPTKGMTITARDADRFAAELLMPPLATKEAFQSRRVWLKDALSVGAASIKKKMVRGLAWQFEVNYAAMAIRLDELKLWETR